MLSRFLKLKGLALGGALVGLVAWSAPSFAAEESLTIGSSAPEINVEHWVQDGGGKFKPVTKFATGKVYVVEFWATWCGPCVASMPHLAELQKNYADKGVQVVSISDEDLETVEKFLEREVRGAKPGDDGKVQTYKGLTSTYCLTTDPDRSCHTSYMEASGQNGIPTAYIVGKDQKIEWIGHPMSMDEPLKKIVADKWDRKKFAEEFSEQQQAQLLMANLSGLMRKGDTAGALVMVEEALAKAKSDEAKQQFGMIRLQIQLNDKGSQEKLPQILAEAYETHAKNTQLINAIAWTLVQRMEGGQPADKAILAVTRKAIEKAAKEGKGDERAAILDTASHVQFQDGDIDAALKTQTEAVEIASAQFKEQLREFLETLRKAKEEKTK